MIPKCKIKSHNPKKKNCAFEQKMFDDIPTGSVFQLHLIKIP